MYQRADERRELMRIFRSGASCQMLAPRRIGKTWLMQRVDEDFRAAGWLTAFIDVEGMRTEEEFLRALCRKIEAAESLSSVAVGHLKQRLKQLVSGGWEGSSIVQAVGHVDPKDFSEALVASLDAQGRDTLILVDEIAHFVKNRLEADAPGALAFVYHLRKLRQAYPRVRWFFTGSIGLDVVGRRHDLLGAFVDLKVFPLEPFSEPAAFAYFAEHGRAGEFRQAFAIDRNAFSLLAGELGWLVPYYLNLIGDLIRPTGEDPTEPPTATAGDIDRAFAELLKPVYRAHFVVWEEHLTKNFPAAEAELLHAILEICCEGASGETTATIHARLQPTRPSLVTRDLTNMLTALCNSGHLLDDEDRWRFRSGLLRRYWLKYYHA